MTEVQHHPINFQCPTCGANAGEACIPILTVPEPMIRKYHNTREAVARHAKPANERLKRMRRVRSN